MLTDFRKSENSTNPLSGLLFPIIQSRNSLKTLFQSNSSQISLKKLKNSKSIKENLNSQVSLNQYQKRYFLKNEESKNPEMTKIEQPENKKYLKFELENLKIEEIINEDLVCYENALVRKINEIRKNCQKGILQENVNLSLISETLRNRTQMFEKNEDIGGELILVCQEFGQKNFVESIFINYETLEREIIYLEDFEETLKKAFEVLTENSIDYQKMTFLDFDSVSLKCDLNRNRLRIIILLTSTKVNIASIKKTEADQVEIRGRFYECSYGPFFLKVDHAENENAEQKKRNSDFPMLLGPQMMSYDLNTGEFCIRVTCLDGLVFPYKKAELYGKEDPRSIKYGVKSPTRVLPNYLEIFSSFWLVEFPKTGNLRLLDRANRIKFEPQKMNRQTSEKYFRKIELTEIVKQITTESNLSEENEEERGFSVSQSVKSELAFTKKASKGLLSRLESVGETPLPIVPDRNNYAKDEQGLEELKCELEFAQEEMVQELKKQKLKSRIWQHRIGLVLNLKRLKLPVGDLVDRSEGNISQTKFENLLNRLLEGKSVIKLIKAKYAKQSSDTMRKLEKRKELFFKIKESYNKLKSEVSKNVVSAKFNRPIVQNIIDKISLKEDQIIETLQFSHMEFLRLKVIYKKKKEKEKEKTKNEQKDLIDVEKLKVENQSTQEKIEDRNETIERIWRKNRQNVHVITHVREKLAGLEFENEQTRNRLEELGWLISEEL